MPNVLKGAFQKASLRIQLIASELNSLGQVRTICIYVYIYKIYIYIYIYYFVCSCSGDVKTICTDYLDHSHP